MITVVCLHRFLFLQPAYAFPQAIHTLVSQHFPSHLLFCYCQLEQPLNFLQPNFLLHLQFVIHLANDFAVPLGIHFTNRIETQLAILLAIYFAIHLAIHFAFHFEIHLATLLLEFEFGVVPRLFLSLISFFLSFATFLPPPGSTSLYGGLEFAYFAFYTPRAYATTGVIRQWYPDQKSWLNFGSLVI